ncbi:MAG: CbbQ/NirQ/NorQ C-terminal domain-containing protein, partial [Methanomicrobia archaeon]|nr:CbbQ/NirQ/NorQ C-terminal domain-containing protein [Methanomicrobia archaeon]
YAGTLLKNGVPMRDALSSTLTEPLTHDADLKRSIEEILKNYFTL